MWQHSETILSNPFTVEPAMSSTSSLKKFEGPLAACSPPMLIQMSLATKKISTTSKSTLRAISMLSSLCRNWLWMRTGLRHPSCVEISWRRVGPRGSVTLRWRTTARPTQTWLKKESGAWTWALPPSNWPSSETWSDNKRCLDCVWYSINKFTKIWFFNNPSNHLCHFWLTYVFLEWLMSFFRVT